MIEKEGLAACSTLMDGWGGRLRLSSWAGCTGGGPREPFNEEIIDVLSASCDAAVLGLDPIVDCLVLLGSSFTGGAGATGSSTGSIPRGPNGPIESSSVSRVVDCARLPYLRGPRVFEGAGLAPLAEAGDEGIAVEVEEVCATKEAQRSR